MQVNETRKESNLGKGRGKRGTKNEATDKVKRKDGNKQKKSRQPKPRTSALMYGLGVYINPDIGSPF